MRMVIQRVSQANVTVDGQTIGQIGRGLMVLIGVGQGDDEQTADRMLAKMIRLRIFEDENGRTNKALKDVDGQLLLVSQFTLYADTRHGNRPGFTNAGDPEMAKRLYEYMIAKARETVPVVQEGIFGADMKVSLVNDGPFTILLDSENG